MLNPDLKNRINPTILHSCKDSIVTLINYCWELEEEIINIKESARDDINDGVNGYEEFRGLLDGSMGVLMNINTILHKLS
mgnify:CR=1 FL=1